MTVMIPDRIPPDAPKSERDAFGLIKEAEGSGEYYCMHSVGLARHERKDYGEADFVMVGPAGIFCIEAKGGEVHRRNGVWEIGWPGKTYVSAEGPFKQAQGCRWPLMREINTRLNIDLGRTAIIGWGVMFPDIE